MKHQISIADLKRYAEKLPSDPVGCIYRVPIQVKTPLLAFDPYVSGPLTLAFVEFRAEHVVVNGVPGTAWSYHDVLVRVSV